MKYRYFISLMLIVLSLQSMHSQENDQLREAPNYNLPPGAVLKPKFKFYDLSPKLLGKTVNYNSEEIKFLKNIPQNSLEDLKQQSPNYYTYYITGINYINSLSLKIKKIYTEEELWYIYAFDQRLKDKLVTIK